MQPSDEAQDIIWGSYISVNVAKRMKLRGRLVSEQPLVLPGYQDDTNKLLRCTCHHATVTNGQRKFADVQADWTQQHCIKMCGIDISASVFITK